MKRKLSWMCAAVIGLSAFPAFMTAAAPATPPLINAEPTEPAQSPATEAPVVAQTAPSREVKLTFAQIAPPPGSMALRGVNPNGGIEFGMRSDEVASKAVLNLEYTPSPSLLPVQSQLKVYLNDELMGVLPVTKEQLGKKTLAQVPINPLFITDFNRVRLEFVGHYRDVCENPASSTLWLDIGRNSALDLTYNMLAVMPKTPTEAQMETLLNTVGAIGGQTGFPAINLTITDDSAQIADKDADLLIIGAIPGKLKDDKRIDLLVQATQSWVKTPMRQTAFPSIMPDEADRAADAQSTVTASGPMAAVVGFQSPFNDQRSVIALLADSPRGYQLLNDAVNDSGKRAAMFGSVAVIRESGVHSLRVGDIYYVGHLPWFERLWYALANHPVLLAVLAALSVVLLAWVLWRLLRILSRRRLDPDHE
ncbi:cellulose biosynthesis cyclic di-GMP-binding regulatory protein BcsB [Salmonella enterica]|nr:hypothetical protein [Salmonella enterica]EHB2667895.1 hypothetical protein [Salmonella enterica subsp. enterica serovar Montevideo]EHC9139651.1 hypothetical protein [Salmonella enterica subsp. enterica serovar Montevideo]EHE0618670.1 hypothetical protein [Salmonella enterica subsp. enterica serovar Montevideo]EHH3554578.1 hypothetical protein [Salmonella enterica subsp. enterica serovar Montevideo]